jgi:hypothetical protein
VIRRVVYLYILAQMVVYTKQQRLKAKTKVSNGQIRELLFADDAVIVSHSVQELQNLLSAFFLMPVLNLD